MVVRFGHLACSYVDSSLLPEFINWFPKPILPVQDDVSLTVSSELIVSSWPPLKNWGEHGWKEAIWSLQHQSSKAHATAWAPSRQEDAAAQPDAPDEAYHADTAHWPSREEAAHQRRFSKGAGGSSSAGMPHGTLVSADCCDGRAHCATHACQRGTRRWTDSGRSCSPQQAEHRTVLTGPPGRRFGEGHPACTTASHGTDALLPKPSWRQQQVSMGHGRHRHGAELSEVAVSISRSTLGAVMRDLAKGLADIRELRCTAEKAGLPSDQAASPLCDRPTSPHDQPPGSQAPAREGSRRAQLSASRPGSAQPEAGLQASQHSAGSRGSRTAEHGSHKAGQRLGASPMGRKKGDHLLHVQQPTGHPMVRWRTSLRSTERPCRTHVPSTRKIPEPRSAGGPRTPASHKNSSKDLPCSGDPSAGVSQQSAVPQRCRAQPVVHRRPGESSGHGVAVLHARPRTGIEGSHRQERHLEHKQGGTALPIAGLIAEQQPCQEHLRQRYLPVYSVFGEKASAADCPDELLCACLARQCTPKAADTPEASAAVEAAQQWQIGNEISLHASSASTHADQARKVQRLHVDNKCSRAQPEHTKSELPSVQEDILRAALQSFAMRTA